MSHPAWKRSYARKAVQLRRQLTDKALVARLGVPKQTLNNWLYRGKR